MLHLDEYSFLLEPIKSEPFAEPNEFWDKLKMYWWHVHIACKLSKLKSMRLSRRAHISVCDKEEHISDMHFLNSLYEDGKFQYILENLFELTDEFAHSQFKENEQCEECTLPKNYALKIFVKSRRLYKYLRVYFQMPCYKSMKAYLDSMPCKCGSIELAYSYLKTIIRYADSLDRCCVLAFGYIPLTKFLSLIEFRTQLYTLGFEDYGEDFKRTEKLADHSLVFMVRSITTRYNIPVAYYYTEGFMGTEALRYAIVEQIKALKSIGITICATVCDHNLGNNMEALQKFIKMKPSEDEPDKTYKPSDFQFRIYGQIIHAMFDAPQLVRETRNALAKGTIEYEEGKHADMGHIKQAFLSDSRRKYKYLGEFNEIDFEFDNSPTKKKMDLASKQFSYKMAVAIETCCRCDELEAEAMNTAEFCVFIEDLFDSLSCCDYEINEEDKPYRKPVSENSPHLKFWSEALGKFRIWRDSDVRKGGKNADLIEAWRSTIESAISLWTLAEKKGLVFLNMRNFNMEPLDNLFNKMREHSFADFDPTCQQIEETLKAVIFNRFSIPGNEIFRNKNMDDRGSTDWDRVYERFTRGIRCDLLNYEKDRSIDYRLFVFEPYVLERPYAYVRRPR